MITLRPYQIEAADAMERSWESSASALAVLATGLGKTVLFIELAKRAMKRGYRSLIIVDSIELLEQTRAKIKAMLSIDADIEMAGSHAITNPMFASPIVIATIQSLRSGEGRMRVGRFDADHFQRIFVDEAHLSITPSTIAVLEHLVDPQLNPNGRLAGFTATPMRGDGRALGQLYETCAYRYDILPAIRDGYLAPVRGKIVRLENVSCDVKHRQGGDFSNEECGEFMSAHEAIVEQATGLLDRCDGPTLVFCPTVRHAELLSAWINDNNPGSAEVVSGQTPRDERVRIIDRFRAGELRFLCNCMVLTKGFDADVVRYVAICRPTKSWSLMTQMIGRGTRTLDGLLSGLDTPEQRRAAIAASDKPHMTVLSFVGREGSMNLVGPADALAGDMDRPEVAQRARELMEESEIDASEALDMAEQEIDRERTRRLEQARVDRLDGQVIEEDTDLSDPSQFKLALTGKLDIPPRQKTVFLNKYGFSKKDIASWGHEKVDRVIEVCRQRNDAGLITRKQANMLKWKTNMSESERRNTTKQEFGQIMSNLAQGVRA